MKTAQRLLLVLPFLLAGCVDQKVPVNFAAVCAPPVDAETCAFSEVCDAVLASARPGVITQRPVVLGGGINELLLPLQLDNQMANNANPDIGYVNTHDAIIESYDFTYAADFPAGKVTAFSANGRVPAAGSTVVVVPVIPQAAMAEIQAGMAGAGVTSMPLVVTVVARGSLLDGSSFETGTYPIAVDVVDAVCGDPSAACQPGELVFECPNVCQTASLKCVAP